MKRIAFWRHYVAPRTDQFLKLGKADAGWHARNEVMGVDARHYYALRCAEGVPPDANRRFFAIAKK